MTARKRKSQTSNLIVISDLHCGCRFGLFPDEQVELDGGVTVGPSELQRKAWSWWGEFWGEWVPRACHGEPFTVVVNGDSTDGVHHGSVTQVSHNLADQAKIAEKVLKPVVDLCDGQFYMIRGTEAHVGKSGQEEERLAKALGAKKDREGHHARYELWIRVGQGLVHILHHIGTTGSQHYESTSPLKELVEAYAEAGRWRGQPPDCIVRSHRHRHIEVRVPTSLGYGITFTTPGWQLKTPFAWKIPGARQSVPQLGGSLVRQGDEDMYTRHFVRSPERPKVEIA